MATYIDHAAYWVADLDWYTNFFQTVFGMDVTRRRTNPDGMREAWLQGGLQLCEDPAFVGSDGHCNHLSLLTDDLEGCRERALAAGCTPMPRHHWVQLPDGLKLELFLAAPGAVAALSSVEKHGK